jgi:hypothetical protein
MSTTQTLIWIGLPNGARLDGRDKFLRLSALMTPRLRSDEGTTLSAYPDFLDWPTLVLREHSNFSVELDDGTEVEAIRVGDAAQPELWRALFTEDIPVRPFEFDDYANRPIVSFPAIAALKYLEKAYRTVASTAPLDLPLLAPREHEDERISIARVFQELIELRSGRLAGC